jgi:hypothetical protein
MENQNFQIKKENLYLIIAIIVGVFAVGIVAFALGKYSNSIATDNFKLEEEKYQPSYLFEEEIIPQIEETEKFNIPIFTNDEPDTVINSVLQSLNGYSLPIKFLNPVKLSQWWISEDGWSINIPNAISIISSASTFKGDHFSPVNPLNPLAKELNDLISKILLDNGFILNALNTSESEENNDFYDYIVAFQKGETRCILETNGDGGQYSIVCSDRFHEAYEEQIPYLKALNKRNIIINVGAGERIGDFVWLNVHLRRTGWKTLIKDDGKEIKRIFSGQEPPPCDLMIENQVPKEVYGACYDASGKLLQ